MLNLILLAALAGATPHKAAPKPAPKPAAAPLAPAAPKVAWSNWLYLQGDKAVQYRVAKVGQEGDTALLNVEFRVEPGNTTACYSASCEGYLVYLAVIDPDTRDIQAKHHLFFPKGATGTWKLPETMRFTPKATDWGKLFLDAGGFPALAHSNTPDEDTRIRIFDTSCVDDRYAGVRTRCDDYDAGQSVTVGG